MRGALRATRRRISSRRPEDERTTARAEAHTIETEGDSTSRARRGILILNAGSSSLKFSLLDSVDHRAWIQESLDEPSTPDSGNLASAVRRVVEEVRARTAADPEMVSVDAVAHRFVHGGSRFIGPVLVTREIRAVLSELSDLAPLHNPASLQVLDAASQELRDVPHVAVFDTAFHATLSPEAFTYALPLDWAPLRGLRRFGFHGLSCAYSSGRAAELLGSSSKDLRLIVAHLGHGASVTAILGGRSVDTTMGFTPLEGLVMGTRSGSVDPGLLLHLLLRAGVQALELEETLNHASGLLGVSGISADMRVLLEEARGGSARASLAIRLFARRARQAIGAMAATLGGVDALVFTGGIGERAASVRAEICDGLACLGLNLDPDLNASAHPDAIVSSTASAGRILILTAREDITMARETVTCLGKRLLGNSGRR